MANGVARVSRRATVLLSGISNVLTLRQNKLWSSALLGTVLLLAGCWALNGGTKQPFISQFRKDTSQVVRKVKADARECDEDEYDVIIIGGGTGGCVLASRLSEDPSIRVLVLEAGQSLSDDPLTHVPVASGAMFRSAEHGFELYTTEQKHANERKLFWPRAKLLGGCTNINAMIFQCGHPTDYDEWASLQKGQEGASGWEYKDFSRYFRKFENYCPSKMYANTKTDYRSSTGVVDVGHYGHRAVISSAFIDACDTMGILRKPDLNTAEGTLGVSTVMTFINSRGNRVTAERAYLTPVVRARSNLKIITLATVTRILFSDGPTRKAVGVEFANLEGQRFQAHTRKEVIISAGAVHTPHILMLSGVGPAKHLSSLDIPVIADLPGVGSHLKDHPTIDLFYKDKSKTSLMWLNPTSFIHRLKLCKNTVQYLLFGTGGLTTNVAESTAFVQSSDPILFPPSQYPADSVPEDLGSGKGAPDIEVFVSPLAYLDHGATPFPLDGDFFSLHAVALRPMSSGSITLKSSNPFEPPVIDPRYLSEEHDVAILIRAIRLLARIALIEPLKSFIDPTGDVCPVPTLHHNIDKLTDAELAQEIKNKVETLYHPCCTARMAPLEDEGVVDPYLRVHGIKNLRVVDASVFPEIVSGHTTAPVLALAEKAADIIKEAVRGR